ncbi:OCIA domain-containing protein 1 isoform X2 [Stegostoma tigrinum]|uniref:OCIA domain-containing protein 1 isoform X2 n=1 Tax=Stegostoma tigrinum TaxID=3053191 RepID=UPI00202B0E27|nr:OCIA domain-containing protein 1 isoform X2 [Stegostoma tigrinum]
MEMEGQLDTSYIPTEEERRVFRECNQESFYYRSLPFSGMSMLGTQLLISRGVLSTSTRFGSIPKIAFAGICGYLIGKISYMKTCQEKFMRLENSPLGDALRQGRRRFRHPHSHQKSEFSDSTVEHVQTEVNSPITYSDDYNHSFSDSKHEPVPFSSTLSESAPTGIVDTTGAPSPEIEESKPQRKSMTYDELRNKNRELYEVTVAQKADSLHKPTPQRLPDNKGVAKTNKYGDTWEE